jgi:hypothetical protein
VFNGRAADPMGRIAARPETAIQRRPPTGSHRIEYALDVDRLDVERQLIAKSYARDIRKHVKSDPVLRAILETALHEQQIESEQQSAESLA